MAQARLRVSLAPQRSDPLRDVRPGPLSTSAGRIRFALLTLGLVALASMVREPSLVVSPRFWAEEGAHYFGSALTHDVVGGLLNVTAVPYAPYLHVLPTIATVAAAHLLPLELAPWA